MPKVSPLQSNFNGGEISPLLSGRVDSDRYKTSLAICKNYVPTVQGGLTRRPGTAFVSEVKTSSKVTRLVPFEFSTTQAYMLEFGDVYIRFYKDNGLITLPDHVITAITQANPAVVTSVAHGFSNGDRVVISGVSGMVEVNNREFIVAGAAANTFQLKTVLSVNVDSTGYGAYVSGGTVSKVYEISSPWGEADLMRIKYTQSADVLYLTHPNYAPRKLTRTGHTNWTLTQINFLDGPYLSQNTVTGTPLSSRPETITLAPAAATGTGVSLSTGPSRIITGAVDNGSGLIRITTAAVHNFLTGDQIFILLVTGTIEANGTWTITVVGPTTFDLQGSAFINAYTGGGLALPGFFKLTDVGRLIRFKEGSVWGYAIIATFIDVSRVFINIINTLTNTTAKSVWRLGVWSDTSGFPAATVFHEDRLFFGGPTFYPQRLDGSNSGDYENFAPSDTAGVITASHAVAFSLNANDVNAIRWMTSDEKGLCVGAAGGEWVVRPSSFTEALSPTNISAKRATSLGSFDIQAYQVGKASLFAQKSGLKIREFAYFYDVDGFRGADMTQVAEHITQFGVTQLAVQKEPQQIVWATRGDGTLIGMTYERELDALKVGWHRHTLGGAGSIAADDPCLVESIAVIPSADGKRDELWLVVKRFIDGATFRFVEYVTKLFVDGMDQRDAFFVDSGLTYDDPKLINAITIVPATDVLITSIAHGLSNGNRVLISILHGAQELSTNTYEIYNVAANSFSLVGTSTLSVSPFNSGGKVRKLVSTVSGLFHLKGETVTVLADGYVIPPKVVSSGGIVTLDDPAATISIGLGYNSDGQMLRLEAGAADGTALGKTRRTHRVGFLFHNTSGFEFGTDFDNLNEIIFRKTEDPLTRAVPLFSGIKSETLGADYDFENQICWRQSDPLPGTVLAVMPQMVTQDRG